HGRPVRRNASRHRAERSPLVSDRSRRRRRANGHRVAHSARREGRAQEGRVTDRKNWSHVVWKRQYRVRVFELGERGGVLYLRWNDFSDGTRRAKHLSLGKVLRTADGKIVRETERWAKAQAQLKHEALIKGEQEAA